jgi:predicted Zn-dependent protease
VTRPRRCILALLLVFPVILCAQTRRPSPNPNPGISNPGGNFPRTSTMGRTARIEIRVTNELSRPLPLQVMVELTGLGGGTIQQAFTDPEGRASFSVPNGKTYQVKVSGSEIESTSSQFDVNTGETFHNESIAVKVRMGDGKGAPGGVVSASMLNVPEKALNEFHKGMKDMDAKKLEDAKKHFIKATEIYPKYDWAFNNIGVIDVQMKDEKGAREAFAHAVELNDKNPDATKNLARMKIQDQDFAGAKELLDKSNTVAPGNPDTLVLLAYSQLKTNQLDEALANAEKCHKTDPDRFPLAHLIAGAVREKKGDRVGAERQYQTFLKEAPDAPQAKVAQDGLARLQAQAKN